MDDIETDPKILQVLDRVEKIILGKGLKLGPIESEKDDAFLDLRCNQNSPNRFYLMVKVRAAGNKALFKVLFLSLSGNWLCNQYDNNLIIFDSIDSIFKTISRKREEDW